MGQGLALLTLYILLSPWTVPNELVDEPCLGRYALRPYRHGRGNLRINEARLGCAPPSEAPLDTPWPPPPSNQSRAVAGRVALEGGYAVAFSHITAATLAARLQLPRRVELSFRLSVLTDLEERPREQALMGTGHLSVRFAQAAHVELRSGIGVRAFGLDKSLAGVDFIYAIDVYGRRPIVANLEFHGGSLGRAGVLEARMTLGYVFGTVELYGGYDHTRINGSAGITRLSGPLAGLRAYF